MVRSLRSAVATLPPSIARKASRFVDNPKRKRCFRSPKAPPARQSGAKGARSLGVRQPRCRLRSQGRRYDFRPTQSGSAASALRRRLRRGGISGAEPWSAAATLPPSIARKASRFQAHSKRKRCFRTPKAPPARGDQRGGALGVRQPRCRLRSQGRRHDFRPTQSGSAASAVRRRLRRDVAREGGAEAPARKAPHTHGKRPLPVLT